MSSINFKIVTPDGVAYTDQILQVTMPTASGEITVLPNHAPLITLLRHGEMVIKKDENGQLYSVYFAVARGIVEVRQGSEVVVMADSADRAEEIDLEQAEAARRRAEEALQNKEALTDIEFLRFQALVDREINKMKIGGKYGRK
jgi:F-type H+-transporting ATPase subunit epsilon